MKKEDMPSLILGAIISLSLLVGIHLNQVQEWSILLISIGPIGIGKVLQWLDFEKQGYTLLWFGVGGSVSLLLEIIRNIFVIFL